MAEKKYIDGGQLYNAVWIRNRLSKNDLLELIDSQPAADVVTRSEVEQLQHKYDLAVAEREANVKGFTEELAKAKSEVAREIFEDIEKLKHTKWDWNDYVDWDAIAELKKKYTGESSNNEQH